MKVVASPKLILWASFFLPLTLLVGIYPRMLNLCIGWLFFILLIVCLDWIISMRFPERVRIDLPSRFSLMQGKGRDLGVGVTNDSKRTLSLRMAFDTDAELAVTPPVIREEIEGANAYTIPVTLESGMRGEREIRNICIEVRSFLGFLLLRQKRHMDFRIRVFPNIFRDNQQLAASLFLRKESGIRSQRIVGHGREFEQLREYLPDDHFSDIAWKATAKRGQPVTKVFQIERTQQIYAVLDHSRSASFSFGDRSNLDVAIESALLLHLCCEKMGDMLGLITFANKISGYCPAGKGKAHFGMLRNKLFDLTSLRVTPDFESLFIFIRQRIRKRGLILLFTNLEDPGLAETFFTDVAIINRSHLVTVCTFSRYDHSLLFSHDQATSLQEIYRRLAAQLSYNEQERLSSRLKQQNVDMLRFRQNRFSVGIIDHYLQIKRRQML